VELNVNFCYVRPSSEAEVGATCTFKA